jgi:hypothetical protein
MAHSTAAKAFSWLLCMREPLSSVAFLDAVSVGIPENQKPNLPELLSICPNLIVVDKQIDTLRFAHVSFKEFSNISLGKYEDPRSAACAGRHHAVAAILHSHKSHSSPETIEPALKISFLVGQEEMSMLLLKSYLHGFVDEIGKDQESSDWLLEKGAQAGFTEAMDTLMKPQSDPLTRQKSAKIVIAAIRKCQVSFIRKLIDKGPLPDDVIATAALSGKSEIINLCADKGYDVSCARHHQPTANALIAERHQSSWRFHQLNLNHRYFLHHSSIHGACETGGEDALRSPGARSSGRPGTSSALDSLSTWPRRYRQAHHLGEYSVTLRYTCYRPLIFCRTMILRNVTFQRCWCQQALKMARFLLYLMVLS